MTPIIAAGFVEITDTPQQFLTALAIVFAYSLLVYLPVRRMRRVRKKEKKRHFVVLLFTFLLPFAARECAVLLQGREAWRDWHFIWIYLLASILVAGVLHSVVAIYQLARKKAQPAATANAADAAWLS